MRTVVPPFTIDPATGLLANTRQVLSPHFDARPQGVLPSLIVVHGISLPPGEFGGPWIDRMFTGNLAADAHPFFAELASQRLSAHVLVLRDGTPVQYVPFGARAWHAGRSEYQGRQACNDFSIGIELEGTDQTPYMPAQYDTFTAIVVALLATYPSLSVRDIAGHSDVAPGRKTDPWPTFDWADFRNRLAAQLPAG